jgi:CBS domain-containing protein
MAERTVIESITLRRVISLGSTASVREAAGVMTRANCGSVLIIEPPDLLLGIVTERDLMTRVLARGLDPEGTTVREVMTPSPVCVSPEMRVSDAVVIMIEKGFRHLPILAPGARILGVFSVRDALPREIGTALGQAEFNDQINDALG